MFKKMRNMTKTKVNSQAALLVVGLVVLICGSLIAANLLPFSSRFAATKPSVTAGYCVYSAHTNGSYAGGYMAQSSCTSKMTNYGIPNANYPSWMTFCVNVSGPSDSKGGDTYCNAGTVPEPSKSSTLTTGAGSRTSAIDFQNDGIANTADQNLKYKWLRFAVGLGYECDIVSTDSLTKYKDEDGNYVKNSDGEYLYTAGLSDNQGRLIRGTEKLLHELGKLLSKMNEYDSATNQCSGILPQGCYLSSSYRDGENGEHGMGKAVDFSCGQKWSTEPTTGCSTLTQSMFDKIKKHNSAFDIIRECNKEERTCNADGSDAQVIHIDLGSSKRPRPGDQPCTWQNCEWDGSDCGDA